MIKVIMMLFKIKVIIMMIKMKVIMCIVPSSVGGHVVVIGPDQYHDLDDNCDDVWITFSFWCHKTNVFDVLLCLNISLQLFDLDIIFCQLSQHLHSC